MGGTVRACDALDWAELVACTLSTLHAREWCAPSVTGERAEHGAALGTQSMPNQCGKPIDTHGADAVYFI